MPSASRVRTGSDMVISTGNTHIGTQVDMHQKLAQAWAHTIRFVEADVLDTRTSSASHCFSIFEVHRKA